MKRSATSSLESGTAKKSKISLRKKCARGECKRKTVKGTRHCKYHIKRCESIDCNRVATYGIPKGKKVYCGDHKLPGTFEDTKCTSTGCRYQAIYGYQLVTGPVLIYCGNHKGRNEVVRSPIERSHMESSQEKHSIPSQEKHSTFSQEKVYSTPSQEKVYSTPSQEKHSTPSQEKHSIPSQEKVYSTPSQEKHSTPSQEKHSIPSQEKVQTNELINFCINKCSVDGCNKNNIPGTQKYCLKHSRQYNVTSTSHQRCKIDGCNSKALYTKDVDRYCSAHGKAYDALLKISIKCKADQCNKFASFGLLLASPTHCNDHKTDGMISRIRHAICTYDECIKYATHYTPGSMVTRCAEHREAGMYEVTKKLCSIEFCTNYAKYDTYCIIHSSMDTLMKDAMDSERRLLERKIESIDNELDILRDIIF